MALETRELPGVDPARAWLATGVNWPDALAVGPAAAATGAVLVLTHSTDLAFSPPTRDVLSAWSQQLRSVRLAGGEAVVSDHVEAQVVATLARPR